MCDLLTNFLVRIPYLSLNIQPCFSAIFNMNTQLLGVRSASGYLIAHPKAERNAIANAFSATNLGELSVSVHNIWNSA